MGYSPWGHRRVGHNLSNKQQKQQKEWKGVFKVEGIKGNLRRLLVMAREGNILEGGGTLCRQQSVLKKNKEATGIREATETDRIERSWEHWFPKGHYTLKKLSLI